MARIAIIGDDSDDWARYEADSKARFEPAYRAALSEDPDSADTVELVSHAVALRGLISANEYAGQFAPRHLFNCAAPRLDHGKRVASICPYDDYSSVVFGLAYEWSDFHQKAFENCLNASAFDHARFGNVVSEYGGHWPNVFSVETSEPGPGGDVAWLEYFAPGISHRLHELGKSVEFRSLKLDGETVKSAYRAQLVAARGMIELTSRDYIWLEPQPRTCAICADPFWEQTLWPSEIRRFGLPRYCTDCLTAIRRGVYATRASTKRQGRGQAIRGLHAFYRLTGAVPHARAAEQVVASLADDMRDLWVVAALVLPSPSDARALFGGWNELLGAADLLEFLPRRGKSGYRSVANDGHIALSLGERTVCDFLHAHGIAHEKEPFYPPHETLNPTGLLRADWLIGDCWVELAGRMNDPGYAARIVQKQDLARDLGIELLILLPAELGSLDNFAQQYWV